MSESRRMKNYGRGTCSCCSGNTRPLWGQRVVEGGSIHVRGNHPQRRYCAPCWNTIGVAPTADYPFSEEHADRGIANRGWSRLVNGT